MSATLVTNLGDSNYFLPPQYGGGALYPLGGGPNSVVINDSVANVQAALGNPNQGTSGISVTLFTGTAPASAIQPGASPAQYRGYGGDGSDGAIVFDGTTTFNGLSSLAGSTYTLSRDIYLASGSVVNSGVTINPNGFGINWLGTFTVNGLIIGDGAAAVGITGGAATNSGSRGVGAAGGNGGTNAVGSAGTASAHGIPGGTGAGGAGGAGTNSGGAAGAYTVATAAMGGARDLFAYLTGFIIGETTGGTASTLLPLSAGAGGGGGGSSAAGTNGGGGGGGGMPVSLSGPTLVNNGIIRSAGGAGAAATGAGVGGGGGGGGGGLIQIVANTISGTGGLAAITAPGGAGGAPVTTGVAGSAGAAGMVMWLQA